MSACGTSLFLRSELIECITEIILATLLLKLRFSRTDDDIVWNLSQIISPSVRRSVEVEGQEVAQEVKGLPLVVESIVDP